jgi:hypothetical protein
VVAAITWLLYGEPNVCWQSHNTVTKKKLNIKGLTLVKILKYCNDVFIKNTDLISLFTAIFS